MVKQHNKLYSLQVIRAIAALLVCGFHAKAQLNHIVINKAALGDFLFKKGSVGVGLFFIMSGFIIVLTTKTTAAKDAWSYTKNFLIKRFFRIAPMYYLLTFLWLLLFFKFTYFTEWKTQNQLIHSLLFLPFENKRPSLFLGWTLNYEMFFYVCVSISLLFSTYRKYVLFALFGIIIALSFFTWKSPYMKMVTNDNMHFFMLGVLIGTFYPNIKSIPKKLIIPFFCVSMLAFVSHYFSVIQWSNHYVYLLMLSATIVSTILLDELDSVSFPKWLLYIGDISFSIYLVHPFILVGFEKIFGKVNTFSPWLSTISFLAQLVLIIAVAGIVYTYIEQKVVAFTNKKFVFKPKI